ncbi:hypothetical protein [Pseudomonas sp. AIG]
MAKPPKKVSVTAAADTTVTTRAEQSNPGYRFIGNTPDASRVDSTTSSSALGTATEPVPRQPAIIVSEMPGSSGTTYSAAQRVTAWPETRLNELTPIGENTGLFIGPDQLTYAQIGNEGRFIVEQDLHGNYYVPLTFSPGIPGPVVTRVGGEASWRIEHPDWQPRQSARGTPAVPRTPVYLSSSDASTLTKADLATGAIRYNKLKQTFIDTADGTVMVRRNQNGEYQQAFATTSLSPDVFFEHIPGSLLWRQKTAANTLGEPAVTERTRPTAEPDDVTPGPSKRPRLDESTTLLQSNDATLATAEPTPFFWLSWGQLNKPAEDSIQLGWLHYPIVPVGSNPAPKLFFVQHPDFAPSRFDAFENMLQTAPSLQPVATFRIGSDPGEIRPGKRFFEKPLTRSVAEAFPDFSDFTARAVARKLFEVSDHSPVITGTGLIQIQAVLHQWKQKPFPATPVYADPLNMLTIAPSIDLQGKKIIPLPAQTEGNLQRLIFDPQRFSLEWKHYKTYPTDLNLRRLLGALLIRAGYDLYPLTHEHRKPTLVFKRDNHDQVFFLKLGSVEHVGLTHASGNELVEPGLPDRIGKDAFLALMSAQARNKVVWLIGGVLKVQSEPDSVFMLRER